jgi:hypothetical protein
MMKDNEAKACLRQKMLLQENYAKRCRTMLQQNSSSETQIHITTKNNK